MSKPDFLKTSALTGAFLSLFFLSSCTNEEDRITATDLADVTTESLTDSYFEDLDDLSLEAAEDENSPASGGRMASDDRFCAEVLSFEGNSESGVIVIDFGNGCTDPRGNIRTGKLNIEYSDGPVGSVGFTVEVTPDNYTINGVKLEGVRTIKRLQSSSQNVIRHEITTSSGKATWPDATVSTRESSFEREIDLTAQTISLDGSASGTNRRGRNYGMQILETLVFKKQCVVEDAIYMAVDGRKKFTTDNREVIVDYGDGTCDRQVTIQIGDFSRTFGVDGK